jgi:hypothetical protein
MKKAILFEPTLLAEVERESPDLYEYYRDCPISEKEFVDYGPDDRHCFMLKEIMDGLELIIELGPYSIDTLIKPFQAGYNYGRMDLEERLPSDHFEFIEERKVLLMVFDLILNYPFYELESLLDENNFGKRDGLLYHKITYQEAQYYKAWETLLWRHEDFNDVFKQINADRKKRSQQIKGMMDKWSTFN